MIIGPIATCIFKLQMNCAPVSSGMGTCGLVGQIGVYTGWVNDIAAGTKAAIIPMDWAGLVLICFVLPSVLSWMFCEILSKVGWIKEGDRKLVCKNIKIQGERQQPSWLLPLVLFMQPYREAVLPHCRAVYIPGDIPW